MKFAVWLALSCSAVAVAQVTATVNINTSQTTPLNANFSGFNDEVPFPAEFFDYRLNDMATQLSPSWVRYPSGLFSDAFDWATGLMVAEWAEQFSATNIGPLINEAVPWVAGKGGGSFVDAANRADFLGAKLIVCVNGYTDTPQSAGAMAAFAKANHIPVAVWELSNEPYLYKTFFPTGLDYVTMMKPYRDAIKAADPNAVVAIFFDDAGDPTPNPPWNQSILSYPNPYWDAITYHHYPAQSEATFTGQMEADNAELATKSSNYVTGYLEQVNPPGTRFLVSEFLPTNDGLGTGSSLVDGTLYGAIYAAEYIMRMSSVPAMLYVGPHALTGTRGVYALNTHYTDVNAAGMAGTSINTLTLNFGYYLTAQPLGAAVLNGVLKNAALVDATTLTGGATVTATGVGQIPALYAQAYQSAAGKLSVVISNKSATVHQVTIQSSGSPVSGTFPIQFISGTDPSVQNTGSDNPVSIEASTSTNPVTIPAYSVVRVDLTNPPVATAVSAASFAPGPVAPSELVTLFGPGISAQTLTAPSLPLGTSLGGVSVQITDSAGSVQLASMVSIASSQTSVVLPSTLTAGSAKVVVLNGTTPVLTGSMTVANSAPGLFSINSDGAGVAAATAIRMITGANVIIPETVFTCDPQYVRSCLGSPLNLGASGDTLYVTLYGTGIRGASSVQCYVAGQSVPVQYAGVSPSSPGLDQVNITIPQSLAGSGDVRLYLVADGISSNVVGLTLQ